MWEFIAGAAVAKFFFGGSSKSKKRCLDESTTDLATVEPGKDFVVHYDLKRCGIRFIVRSSEPVDVYFMRSDEAEKFRKNESFMTFTATEGVIEVKDEYSVHRGEYTLLVNNRGKKTAAVSYGLWSSRR